MAVKGSGQSWYTDDKGRPRQTQEGRAKKARGVKARRIEYLRDKVCGMCGQPGAVVTWRPEHQPQPFSSSVIWTYGEQRRQDYLKLTWVLCQKHFDLSKGRTRQIEHGGGTKGRQGCDCIPCVTKRRERGAADSRKYRARRRARKQLEKEREQDS